MNAPSKKEEATPTGLDLLRIPFPANQISKLCRSTKRDNTKGKCGVCGGWHGLPAITLDYVGHAALTDRLLDTDPQWTWEPMAIGQDGYPVIDESGGMWIKLTVCGVTRYGYGDAQGKIGGDAMKERIGDALRNAAMRFGAALDLWHKGDLHVDEEEKKSHKSVAKETAATLDEVRLAQAKEAADECLACLPDEMAFYEAYETHKKRLDADTQVAMWGMLSGDNTPFPSANSVKTALAKGKAQLEAAEIAAQA
jgi:hypothetical protein